jgi:hypothetical protein
MFGQHVVLTDVGGKNLPRFGQVSGAEVGVAEGHERVATYITQVPFRDVPPTHCGEQVVVFECE